MVEPTLAALQWVPLTSVVLMTNQCLSRLSVYALWPPTRAGSIAVFLFSRPGKLFTEDLLSPDRPGIDRPSTSHLERTIC